jgi:hypothetical protein
MNYDHASTDIDAEERASKDVKGTGSGGTNGAIPPPPPPGSGGTNGAIPPPPPPGAVRRSDFAASAAMVNDILAVGPPDHAEDADQLPPDPPEEATAEPEPTIGASADGAISADFFARSKSKKAFWQMSKPKKEPRREKEPKKPFWQMSKRNKEPRREKEPKKPNLEMSKAEVFYGQQNPKKPSGSEKSGRQDNEPGKPKKPFWQMKLTLHRRRAGAHRVGAHSEGRRRSLPDP